MSGGTQQVHCLENVGLGPAEGIVVFVAKQNSHGEISVAERGFAWDETRNEEETEPDMQSMNGDQFEKPVAKLRQVPSAVEVVQHL